MALRRWVYDALISAAWCGSPAIASFHAVFRHRSGDASASPSFPPRWRGYSCGLLGWKVPNSPAWAPWPDWRCCSWQIQSGRKYGFAAVAVLPQFGWGQQAVGRQTLQVDKIGISGGGARGLVWAIAIGGRIQRQYLPAGLTGGVEKIHKIIGFAAETADAEFSRQAADGHNDTGFVGKTEILFVILKNSLCDKVFYIPL